MYERELVGNSRLFFYGSITVGVLPMPTTSLTIRVQVAQPQMPSPPKPLLRWYEIKAFLVLLPKTPSSV